MTTNDTVPQTADTREERKSRSWERLLLLLTDGLPLPDSVSVYDSGAMTVAFHDLAPARVWAGHLGLEVDGAGERAQAESSGNALTHYRGDLGGRYISAWVHEPADLVGVPLAGPPADEHTAEEPQRTAAVQVVACTWWHYGSEAFTPVQCGKPAGHHEDPDADAAWILHVDALGSAAGPWFAGPSATGEPERTLTAPERDAARRGCAWDCDPPCQACRDGRTAAERIKAHVGEPLLPVYLTRDGAAYADLSVLHDTAVETGEAAQTCGARYQRKPYPDRWDRIVRCGKPFGHTGDHEDFIGGKPSGNTWPRPGRTDHAHGWYHRPGLGYMPTDANCDGCCEIATGAASLGLDPHTDDHAARIRISSGSPGSGSAGNEAVRAYWAARAEGGVA